jgi:hypothetical protein
VKQVAYEMRTHPAPIAVIAPHLVYPAINGSDISLERVARYLSQHASHVDLLSCNAIRRYRSAEVESEFQFHNQLRPQRIAAVRTILRRSHYLIERLNTNAATRAVNSIVFKESYGTVLASYLTTLSMLPTVNDGARVYVWTHNDDIKWFEDLEKSTRNPFAKAVSRLSLRWLYRELPRLAERAVFLHVSDNDRQGFDRIVPGHRHHVVSVGTDIDVKSSADWVSRPDNVILSFIGSLGVRMAFDALLHFHKRFEPALRAKLGAKLTVQIVGSNPAQSVRDLSRQAGWRLYENVSDEELAKRLAESTFTLLPFAYVTGIKLKLIRSLGGGVPFLSTLAPKPPGFALPPGCCFSDDPADWVRAVNSWLDRNDLGEVRARLLAVAQEYSWPAVVSRLAETIL